MKKWNNHKNGVQKDLKQSRVIDDLLLHQKSKASQKQQTVSIFQLFRFASKLDFLFMFLGLLGAIVAACAMPAFQILWAVAMLQFMDSQNAINTLIMFIYIGAILFVGISSMMFFWGVTGHRQTQMCKKAYFNSLLKKKVGWYDLNDQARIISSFSRQINAYKAAVSNKIAIFLLIIASFVSKTGVSLYYGWYLTLMLLIGFPLLVVSTLIFRKFEQKKTKVQLDEYCEADARSQQAISNIQTVKIFNGQNYQVQRYKNLLQKAQQKTLIYGYVNGANMGILSFILISMYAWGFYYGSLLLQDHIFNPNTITTDNTYNAGIIIALTNLIVVQIFQIIQFYPTLKYIQEGKIAAYKIYKIIDSVQDNQTIEQGGIIPKQLIGIIRFEKVSFSYPKNKDVKILNKASFQINEKTTAIIGQSGCGKSTIFQLLIRLYEPDQGTIYIDGIDIKLINLSWLRNQISFVVQEPPLLFGTIRDNMLFGNPQASEQDIIKALKIAEAWKFISLYKQQIDTNIGQGGSLLSGGQKQRVAIAQALVKNPKILLMDQATSALDKRNQQLIQRRILKLSNQPKILFIAHRQSTIRSASSFIHVQHLQATKKTIDQINFKDNQLQDLVLNRIQSKQLGESLGFSQQIIQNAYKQQHKKSGFLQLVYKNSLNKKKSPLNIPDTMLQLVKQSSQQALSVQQHQKNDIPVFKKLFYYSLKQKKAIALTLFSILVIVTMYPMFGVFIGKGIAVLLLFPQNQPEFRSSINGVVLALFLVAIGSFISKFIQHSAFSYIGSKITKQIRIDTYKKIMRMPLSNFSSFNVGKGTISSLFSYRLSVDALRLNSLTTSHVGILIQVALIIVVGFIVSIAFEYRIGLIMLGFTPLIFLFSFIQMSFNDQKSQQTLENSILSQALNNIKMLYSYNNQLAFQTKFKQAIKQSGKNSMKSILVSSFLFGLSQYSIFIVFGLILFISTQIFAASPQIQVDRVMISIFCSWIGVISAGTQFYYLPDAVKAQNSAKNILEILSQQDEDQKQLKQGSQMIKQIKIQSISFREVVFSYNSEKTDRMILNGFNLQINQKDSLSIVGQSGCGKSTFWKLIMRLYDPIQGEILINGINVRQYDIHALRKKFGVVNQQPVLFNDDFMDNIKYSQQNVSSSQVFQICKKVNAWNFILNNKQKEDFDKNSIQKQAFVDKELSQQQILKCFSRNLGPNGSHISGGQKQRIAIARMLIRNPQVVILDQATSALDTLNTEIVRSAIKDSKSINTKLQITHNLKTIKENQEVAVLHNGIVKEKGKKQNLKQEHRYFQRLILGKRMSLSF